MDSRYILELGQLGPSDEVDKGDEGEGVIKNNSKVSGLNKNLVIGGAITLVGMIGNRH